MESSTTSGRLVAIDYGTKRVGIAVTDTLQLIATPLTTVHAQEIFTFLQQYAAQEPIAAFVVGMPRRLNNEETNATPHVRGFVRKLQATFPDKEVHLVDERFTSQMALQAMIAGGSKKKDRAQKGNIDKVSAAIILQSFMERRALRG
ncbi:putative holliday junction resolvase [Catalinimonas alkaloidigena]|uniref:Putative pre-16S rRNA nuclease n=1 Tax=Catalinimonas alkaloidigena TaxID=1075417 RepID=A0A1G9EYC2_9BACT|nr:Holliday junction resolvase RuvX [Catalinimonas alkaloidigena]SDK81149.1 putative holliday junction resolvase [Catalinimonas alkaloidigena]